MLSIEGNVRNGLIFKLNDAKILINGMADESHK